MRLKWFINNVFGFSFQTFRRLLISKLQDEFENRARNVERKMVNSVSCIPIMCIFVIHIAFFPPIF